MLSSSDAIYNGKTISFSITYENSVPTNTPATPILPTRKTDITTLNAGTIMLTHLSFSYNPTDFFQQKDFKDYYLIPQKNTIEVKYFGIFEKIEKRVKDEQE